VSNGFPASTDLFSDLPEALAAGILANAKSVKLAADEILFLAGDPGDGCYRLNEGLLKVSYGRAHRRRTHPRYIGARFDRR
jgi:CRP-like cAMP-binding protein